MSRLLFVAVSSSPQYYKLQTINVLFHAYETLAVAPWQHGQSFMLSLYPINRAAYVFNCFKSVGVLPPVGISASLLVQL
jgi:hypothetical protein